MAEGGGDGGVGGAKSRGHSPGHFSPCTDKVKNPPPYSKPLPLQVLESFFREDPLASFSARKIRKFATFIISETRNQDGSISNILSCERFSQSMSYDHKFRKLRAISGENFMALWPCDFVTLFTKNLVALIFRQLTCENRKHLFILYLIQIYVFLWWPDIYSIYRKKVIFYNINMYVSFRFSLKRNM